MKMDNSHQKSNTHIKEHMGNEDILTLMETVVNQNRENIHKHTVKMVLHEDVSK